MKISLTVLRNLFTNNILINLVFNVKLELHNFEGGEYNNRNIVYIIHLILKLIFIHLLSTL